MTALQAIKATCLECCAGDRKAAKECTIARCPIYQFLKEKSLEKASKPKRVLSDEQREELAKRLKKYRENKAQNATKAEGEKK